MHLHFISSKNTGENRTIYVWSNNKSIMWGKETDNIIGGFFKSFLSINLMNYKLHKVSLERGGSYIKSS